MNWWRGLEIWWRGRGGDPAHPWARWAAISEVEPRRTLNGRLGQHPATGPTRGAPRGGVGLSAPPRAGDTEGIVLSSSHAGFTRSSRWAIEDGIASRLSSLSSGVLPAGAALDEGERGEHAATSIGVARDRKEPHGSLTLPIRLRGTPEVRVARPKRGVKLAGASHARTYNFACGVDPADLVEITAKRAQLGDDAVRPENGNRLQRCCGDRAAG